MSLLASDTNVSCLYPFFSIPFLCSSFAVHLSISEADEKSNEVKLNSSPLTHPFLQADELFLEVTVTSEEKYAQLLLGFIIYCLCSSHFFISRRNFLNFISSFDWSFLGEISCRSVGVRGLACGRVSSSVLSVKLHIPSKILMLFF